MCVCVYITYYRMCVCVLSVVRRKFQEVGVAVAYADV